MGKRMSSNYVKDYLLSKIKSIKKISKPTIQAYKMWRERIIEGMTGAARPNAILSQTCK